MSELSKEDKKLHRALNNAMKDDVFYDTVLEAAQAKQIKQLQSHVKELKEIYFGQIRVIARSRITYKEKVERMVNLAEQALTGKGEQSENK